MKVNKKQANVIALSNVSYKPQRRRLYKKVLKSEKPDLVIITGELGPSLIRRKDKAQIEKGINKGRYPSNILEHFELAKRRNVSRYKKTVREFLRVLKDYSPRITVTPGNHDHFETLAELCYKENIPLLHKCYGGYSDLFSIYGLGGGIEGFMWGPLCLDESEIEEKLRQAKNVDIFVLHPTPEDYFDEERGKARGSSFLRNFIEDIDDSVITIIGHPRIYGAKYPKGQKNRIVISPGGLTRDSFVYTKIRMNALSTPEIGFGKYVEKRKDKWKRSNVEETLKKIKLESRYYD